MHPRLLLPLCLGAMAVSGLIGFQIGSSRPSKTIDRSPIASSLDFTRLPTNEWKPGEPRYIVIAQGHEDLSTLCQKIVTEKNVRKRVRMFQLLINTLQPDEFPIAYKEVIERCPPLKSSSGGTLVSAWAEVAPLEAWKFVQGLSVGDRGRYAGSIIYGWLYSNETEAIAFVKSQPPRRERASMEAALISRLGQQNPALAVELLRSTPHLDTAENWGRVTEALGNDRPERAIEIALQLPEGKGRKRAIEKLVHQWAQSQPEAAYSWINQLPEDEDRPALLRTFLDQLAYQDPSKAGDFFIKELEKRPSIANAVYHIARRLGETDRDAAFRWLEQLPRGEVHYNAENTIISKWAIDAPEEAMAHAMTVAAPAHNSPIVTVLDQWMESNPAAGMKWIEQNLSHLNPYELRNIVYRSSQHRPKEMLDLILKLPDGNAKFSLIDEPAKKLTKSDPKLADEMLKGLPEGEYRTHFLSGYTKGLAEQSLDKATAFARTVSDPKEKEAVVQDIASQLIHREPAAVISWFVKEAKPEAVENRLPSLISTWTSADPSAAAEWVGQLPKGKTRDKVVSSLVNSLSQTSIESASRWASSIQDPSLQNASLQSVASTWMRLNPEQAKAWIKSSALTEPQKSAIIGNR